MSLAELSTSIWSRLARRNRTQVFPDRGYDATQMIFATPLS